MIYSDNAYIAKWNLAPELDLVIKNGTVVTDSEIFQADIGVEGGVICQIGRSIQADEARTINADGKIVIPGGIDGHTHFGYVSTDDFESGTRSAAGGGTTTVINFARHLEGKSLMQSLEEFRKMADPKVVVDYSAHAYIRFPSQAVFDEIGKMVEAGIPSFKVAMTHRKEGFMLDDGAIVSVMQKVAEHGALLGIHCENNPIIEHFEERLLNEGKRSVKYFDSESAHAGRVRRCEHVCRPHLHTSRGRSSRSGREQGGQGLLRDLPSLSSLH